MRKSIFAWAFGLLAALALAAAAGATIVSTSGQMTLIAPPPSVDIGALQSNTTMYAFNEQQCVRTTADLPVDITVPGTYDDTSKLTPGVIPAGTLVSSHFVNADKVGTQPPRIELEGSIVTDADILGIAILSHSLNVSDILGAPGTIYPTGKFGRGLNLDDQNDFVIEQIDKRTVVVHSDVRVHTDQVRVITRCAETLGSQGCTPGYWKQPQHFDSWAVYTQTDKYDSVFGVTAFPASLTLLGALGQGGGGIYALGRHSTAALLNAVSPNVNYPITSVQVIALTKAALDSGNATLIEQTKNQLESYNQLGCPIS
jgi:hypothetical protein